MSLGNIMLGAVLVAAALYVGVLVTGMIALWPYGAIGLGIFAFIGIILGATVVQRLNDKEGEHYSRNVKE
ncbi:hypothetical protein HK107_00960 [Parvularcula sp. ZS-1/3]|uniref:Uncharacterized protein n=1 Tax=Parvularcula mediterranea TaxID=2732508 RepID=A0A7Y3RJX4_9PROT|nr:hypothetical protein [Parvularcula mediterranea]NNU14891.1 hypothetical protein [Parvularcula mediterranea]